MLDKNFNFRIWNNNIVKKPRKYEVIGINGNFRCDLRLFDEIELWTGLRDIKGKKIFENDIVEVNGVAYLIAYLQYNSLFKFCAFDLNRNYNKLSPDALELSIFELDNDLTNQIKACGKVIGNFIENYDLIVNKPFGTKLINLITQKKEIEYMKCMNDECDIYIG